MKGSKLYLKPDHGWVMGPPSYTLLL